MDYAMIPIISTLSFFGAIVAIVVLPKYFRSREQEAMQATIRAAIEKGQPLPPEMIETLKRGVRTLPSAARDLRTGIIWLSVAAGFAGLAYALGFSEDAGDAFWPLMGVAAFPGFIGIAFLIMALISRGKGQD